MKKFIFFCAIMLLLLSTASGEGIITQDFYLYDREFATFREKITILPNTLRLSLTEGESEELWAEVMPRAELSEKLSWRLRDNSGAVTVYPRGASCAVYANTAGEDSIEISLDGEYKTVIEVRVEKGKEVNVRSFEMQEEKTSNPRAESFIRIMTLFLVSFSVVILTIVVLFFIKNRRK